MTDASTQTAPPADGGFIADGDFAGLAPDKQALYSRTPGQGGEGSKWQLRSEFEKAQPGDKTDPKPADAIDPARMGAEKITLTGKDGVTFELDAFDVARLMETKASEDLRKTQLPVDANGYEVKLPDTFKPSAWC